MGELVIRQYHKTDLEAVLSISADTAFFGEPVEIFLEDRNLYNDAFTRYYCDFETQTTWVAVRNGEIIGFILGSADTSVQTKHWRSYIISTRCW